MRSSVKALGPAASYLAGHAVGLGSLAAAAGLLALPRRLAFEGPALCPFRHLLGIPCPGCGLTRSLWLTVHGEVGQGLLYHPLGPALFLLLWVWGVDSLPIHHRAWKHFLVRSQGAVFGALAAVWAVRLALGWRP